MEGALQGLVDTCEILNESSDVMIGRCFMGLK